LTAGASANDQVNGSLYAGDHPKLEQPA
jgi:hypothetical protein